MTALLRYARALRAWAEDNIARYEAGIDWLTPEWHRLDAECVSAYTAIPPAAARVIDWHVFRRLDYLHRTGQE